MDKLITTRKSQNLTDHKFQAFKGTENYSVYVHGHLGACTLYQSAAFIFSLVFFFFLVVKVTKFNFMSCKAVSLQNNTQNMYS